MNRMLYPFVFMLLILIKTSSAQNELSLDQAIEKALKNNLEIQIARNQAVQASNNNSYGNAGMLPTLNLNASANTANNATKQEFSNGLVVDKTGVKSLNVNTGAYLSWTVFDGLKMFATHKRLQEMEAAGMLSMKIKTEEILVNVINTYYTIVMQKQLISGLKTSMAVSEERLKIAEKKLEIGVAAKTEVLQAKIDLNAQRSALLKQMRLLNENKEALNAIMLEPLEQNFEVSDSIPVLNELKYENLKSELITKNNDLLFSQKNADGSKYLIKESRAAYLPKINLNANYLFTRSENQAGFSLLNQNLGLNLGFTASWSIFNGFVNSNNVKNMKINWQNNQLNYESIKTKNQLKLLQSFKQYEEDKQLIELENENMLLASENLNISLERFKLGQSTSVELKMAQQSYEEALNRTTLARYNGKISETTLLKLTGGILK